jgi:hypothetical protein
MKSTVLQNLQQLPGSSKQLDAGIIRRYTAADHPRIAEICRNVCECSQAACTLAVVAGLSLQQQRHSACAQYTAALFLPAGGMHK